jgi:hypothetical protein
VPLELALAKKLRHFRVNIKCMSQKEAAEDSGIPLPTFVVAERGQMGYKTKRRVLSWIGSRGARPNRSSK